MCDSKLSGLRPFDNMAISWVKNRSKTLGRLWVHEAPILKVFLMTLTENSSAVKNDTQEPREYPHHREQLQGHTSMRNMALKLPQYFNLMMEKPLGHYFSSPVSLISSGTVQPETTYSCILKVTGQVWESEKRTRTNTNHSFYQR